MTTNIFEKILYGLKVANDNIIAVNGKMDALMQSLTYEETEPNDATGADDTTTVGGIEE